MRDKVTGSSSLSGHVTMTFALKKHPQCYHERDHVTGLRPCKFTWLSSKHPNPNRGPSALLMFLRCPSVVSPGSRKTSRFWSHRGVQQRGTGAGEVAVSHHPSSPSHHRPSGGFQEKNKKQQQTKKKKTTKHRKKNQENVKTAQKISRK